MKSRPGVEVWRFVALILLLARPLFGATAPAATANPSDGCNDPPLPDIVEGGSFHLRRGGRRLSNYKVPPFTPVLPARFKQTGRLYRGTFRLCVSKAGTVRKVCVLQSTGEIAIDEAWRAAFKKWIYEPYVPAGKPTRFCETLYFQDGT